MYWIIFAVAGGFLLLMLMAFAIIDWSRGVSSGSEGFSHDDHGVSWFDTSHRSTHHSADSWWDWGGGDGDWGFGDWGGGDFGGGDGD